MEEFTQLSAEDVKKIIKDFPVKPRYNKLIVTVNMYEEGGVVFHDEGVSETQYIVARGSRAEYEAGTKIILDLKRMVKYKADETDSTQKIPYLDFHPVEVDGVTFAWLDESYILGEDLR